MLWRLLPLETLKEQIPEAAECGVRRMVELKYGRLHSLSLLVGAPPGSQSTPTQQEGA